MRRGRSVILVVLVAALAVCVLPSQSAAQQKKLVYWSHWEQMPTFNKWYETKGKEFAKKTGY